MSKQLPDISRVRFDFIVYIGRLTPPHIGHIASIERALELADKVIVVLGSADRPRSIKDPWTINERKVMIRHSLQKQAAARIVITSVADRMYNDAQWLLDVQRVVASAITEAGGDPASAAVGLIGLSKDASSFYLDMFPQWPRVTVGFVDGLSATEVRDLYFGLSGDEGEDRGRWMKLEASVPEPVIAWLRTFRDSADYTRLATEWRFIRDYRAAWSAAPYPPTFVTTDAVVVHSGHILLIRRRAAPGKGLWALPGGFVGQDERLQEAAIRELIEETGLKLPEKVLRGSIAASHVFDHPDRSLRGRTVTHAFHFDFPAGELPRVKGGDDADKAQWFPLAQLENMRAMLYEDHFDIINFFIGVV
ncbi:bifunctional nicotinamide-nucleotide adenylyltransferase/Nudix hydroxylase [Methyloversatilis universalis]|uniref:bifunctional nicotinamide-nucleotide adenylyltransferase/Nudix hydroxylase n=1 Tax=Methyloversatilis universalis TaxID=378211 RepID=UPI00037A6DA3|nr:bifunctional nicotinamide-nucleotide adenylyltransferase/Nudix hydroxylase [Methyloversatilis universalis]